MSCLENSRGNITPTHCPPLLQLLSTLLLRLSFTFQPTSESKWVCVNCLWGVLEKKGHTGWGVWAIKWRLWLSLSHSMRSTVEGCCLFFSKAFVTKTLQLDKNKTVSASQESPENSPWVFICKSTVSIALSLYCVRYGCCASGALPFLLDH